MTDKYQNVLRQICNRLQARTIKWVITGSLGMALQGVPVEVHDIDIQTDAAGAYLIEQCFTTCVTQPVHFSSSAQIRSHFGTLEIEGIKIEIMGDLQKRLSDQSWEEPVKVGQYREWLDLNGLKIPVLSLAYEYQAYLTLGRLEKAKLLGDWLESQAKSAKEQNFQSASDA